MGERRRDAMTGRRTYRSAVPVSLGVALIGCGTLALMPVEGVGILLLGAGLGCVVVGVYQLVDNLDRAARKIVEDRL